MSLLINEAYASPSTPLWASTINPVFSGVVYASEFQTTGGGDIVLKDLSGNTALRLATGATTPSPAYLQTSTSLYLGQVGQGTVNTTFTPSAPSANADLFTIGGAIILKDISGNTSGRFDCPSVSNVAIQASNAILFQQVGGLTGNTSLQVKAAGQQDIFTTGQITCDGLTFANPSGAETVGSGTLASGIATISTTASDVTSYIFLTRTNLNGTPPVATGNLRVTNKSASNFSVASVDSNGAVLTGDASSFDWLIINPA